MKIHVGVFLLTLIILIPKIVIITIGSGDLRLEDIITLVALIWLFFGNKLALRSTDLTVKVYLLLLLVQVISIAINFDNSWINILYPIRLLEYIVWYFVGINIAKTYGREKLVRLMSMMVVFFSAWSLLEYFQLTPKFGDFVNSNRISTTMSGPYEFAVVISILGFYSRSIILKSLAFSSLLLTQARVTIVATLFSFFASGSKSLRKKVVRIAGVFMFVILFFLLGIDERFKILESKISYQEILISYYDNASASNSSDEYFSDTHDKNYDLFLLSYTDHSLEIRLMRWAVILKTNAQDFFRILLGSGPGYFGVAIDSYYMRLYAESGVIGLIIFLSFICLVYKRFRYISEFKSVVLCISITALLIDIFASFKVMSLFWFLIGYESFRLKDKINH